MGPDLCRPSRLPKLRAHTHSLLLQLFFRRSVQLPPHHRPRYGILLGHGPRPHRTAVFLGILMLRGRCVRQRPLRQTRTHCYGELAGGIRGVFHPGAGTGRVEEGGTICGRVSRVVRRIPCSVHQHYLVAE